MKRHETGDYILDIPQAWAHTNGMGELAETWGQHMAESRVTDFIQAALDGRPIPPMSGDELISIILGEIGAIHQFLLDLAVTVDRLGNQPTI